MNKLQSLKSYTILTVNRFIFVKCTENFATINNMDSGFSVFSYYNVDIIFRKNKSRSMRWAGHVACMGRRGMHIGFWWKSQKEKDHSDDLEVCEMDLEKQDGVSWTGLIWFRIGTSGGLL
jgi:hypothetical protein